MASILRFDNWQNSDGTSIATTDASGNISFAGSLGATAGLGKILQVVRATDTTNRTTTSTSFVDANISVTITPTNASSDVLILWLSYNGQSAYGYVQITDSSNVAIDGAEGFGSGSNSGVATIYDSQLVIGYDSPATTSATTYKGRFRAASGTAYLFNASNTGQMFALEVGA